MGNLSRITDFIKILFLDRKAIKRISGDKPSSSISVALIFLDITINSLTIFISPIIFGKIRFSFVTLFYLLSLMVIIGLALIHSMARLFGSESSFYSFLRPIGSFFLLDLIVVLAKPTFRLVNYGNLILTLISCIWALLIFYVVIKEIYKFSNSKIIAFIIVNFLIVVGFIGIVSFVLLTFFPYIINNLL